MLIEIALCWIRKIAVSLVYFIVWLCILSFVTYRVINNCIALGIIIYQTIKYEWH